MMTLVLIIKLLLNYKVILSLIGRNDFFVFQDRCIDYVSALLKIYSDDTEFFSPLWRCKPHLNNNLLTIELVCRILSLLLKMTSSRVGVTRPSGLLHHFCSVFCSDGMYINIRFFKFEILNGSNVKKKIGRTIYFKSHFYFAEHNRNYFSILCSKIQIILNRSIDSKFFIHTYFMWFCSCVTYYNIVLIFKFDCLQGIDRQ